MNSIRRHVALAASLIVAAGCSSSGDSSGSITNAAPLVVTASAPSAVADGTSTITIHVDGSTRGPVHVVTNRGLFAGGSRTVSVPATPFDVTLYSCSSNVDASCAGSATVQAVDANLAAGSVGVTFTAEAGSSGGTDGGTDGGSDGGTGGTDGGTPAVTPTGVLAQITLAATQPNQYFTVLGVRSSGFQETSLIAFQLLDTAGQPIPAGVTVTFTHQRLNGSFIGASAATCVAGPPPSCTVTATTDAIGHVIMPLTSGQTAGVVAVTASATAGGATATFTAGNFVIVGAKASGAHITIDCSPKNVPALSYWQDCTYSHYVGPDSQVTCAVTLADRFNNVLGIPTQVAVYSEAGSAGPPSMTGAFGATDAGTALNFIHVTGGTLPWDVTPFGGEFSVQHGLDDCGVRTHNPRDGLVTVIAVAYGEEGFVDLNGNGVHDAGEPYIDMGEPYVDVNDNGVYDGPGSPALAGTPYANVGEPFVDVNQNGAYDGPNGSWDANGVIWAETRILYTDFPTVLTLAGTPPLNALSRWGGPVPQATPQPTLPPPPATTPADTFLVNGTVTGPTSVSSTVVFMDGNLNRPSHLTTFALGAEGSGAVTAKYLFAPDTLDGLGMSFTQQYCDSASNPTVCSNVCPTAPCFVVTNVGACNRSSDPAVDRTICDGFGYGNPGVVTITGACSTRKSEVVDATATLNGVNTVLQYSGDCKP
jgi:hypothetical protein